MRIFLLIWILSGMAGLSGLVVPGLAAQKTPETQKPPDSTPASFEARLVEAELLEVGNGDLEKAMALYEALRQDAKAPEPVRARAALYLARCLRKKGQLGTAEKTLTGLIAAFPNQKAVVAEAESYLQELQSGEATEPAFDWMQALKQNPEIQARIFNLAMDLANFDPSSASRANAFQQLFALGRTATPVLEKLCDTTQNAGHRKTLALLAVLAGRFDRVGVLFGRQEKPYTLLLDAYLAKLFSWAAGLTGPERERFLKALDRVDPQTQAVAYLVALRLAAGDVSDLVGKLEKVETIEFGTTRLSPDYGPSGLSHKLTRLVQENHSLEPALVERLKSSDCPPMPAALYCNILGQRLLDLLSPGDFVEILDRAAPFDIRPGLRAVVAELVKRGGWDTLAALAARERLVHVVAEPYEEMVKAGKLAEIPGGWARVLLAGRKFNDLHGVAERNDAFVTAFVSFLKQRARLDPGFRGWGKRASSLKASYGTWRPSAAYVKAMLQMLQVDDIVVQGLAVEALALAPKGVGPDAGEALLALASRESEDGDRQQLARLAAAALVMRMKAWTGREAETARVFAHKYYWRSTGLLIGSPTGREIDLRFDAPENLLLLLRYMIRLPLTVDQGDTLRSFVGFLRPNQTAPVIQAALADIQDPALLNRLLSVHRNHLAFLNTTSQGREILRNLLQNRKLDAFARCRALELGWPESADWLDWAEVFRTDGPLSGQLRHIPGGWTFMVEFRDRHFYPWFQKLPLDRREQLLLAKLENPEPQVRMTAIVKESRILGPSRRAFLVQAFQDPDPDVQWVALRQLLETRTADVEPILVEALNEPRSAKLVEAHLKEIVDALVQIASPTTAKAFPSLVKLLDHPNLDVRGEALRGLRQIRQALEEKKAWKQLVETGKPTGKETSNPERPERPVPPGLPAKPGKTGKEREE